jgi:hypothetical protein
MKKYKKTYAFRLEIKEAEWLDNEVRTQKLSPSTVLRNLIREKISLLAAFTPKPQTQTTTTVNKFGGKTLQDWENEFKSRTAPQPQEAQPT